MRDVLAKMRECGKLAKMLDFLHDCGTVDTYDIGPHNELYLQFEVLLITSPVHDNIHCSVANLRTLHHSPTLCTTPAEDKRFSENLHKTSNPNRQQDPFSDDPFLYYG